MKKRGVQKSFVVDEATAETIEELQKDFGVSTSAAVIRKALGLALVAARNAGKDHTITILDEDGNKQKIILTS